MILDNRARDVEISEIKRSLEFAHEMIREQKSVIDNLKMSYKNVCSNYNTLSAELKEFKKTVAEDHERLIYHDEYTEVGHL